MKLEHGLMVVSPQYIHKPLLMPEGGEKWLLK
jgi:hypothetical protein